MLGREAGGAVSAKTAVCRERNLAAGGPSFAGANCDGAAFRPREITPLCGKPKTLRRLFRLFGDDYSRELHYFLRRVAVLAKSGFERQLTVGDLTQGNISVTHPGNELDHRTMSKSKLPNPA